MKSTSPTTAHDLQKVNQHITTFVDMHEETVLPLPFLSEKLTSKIFFTPLSDSGYFSTEDCQHEDLKKFLYLGEVLLLFPEKKSKLFSKVDVLRNAFGITKKQIKTYLKLEEYVEWVPIGSIIHFSEVEPMIVPYGISADFLFRNQNYKAFCKENPIFNKYNFIVKMVFYDKNFQEIA